MNLQPVEVNDVGVYCVKFLTSGNVELGGSYNQTQCKNSTTIPNLNGKYIVNFDLPDGTYVIPKLRVFKDSYISYYKDFLNIAVNCDPNTTIPPPTTAVPTTVAPVEGALKLLLYEPDVVEDDFFELTVTPNGNGTFTITDTGNNQGLNVYYKINGASKFTDARQLSNVAIPGNEEFHVIKYGYSSAISNVNDPNGNAWEMYYDSESPLPCKLASFTAYIQTIAS